MSQSTTAFSPTAQAVPSPSVVPKSRIASIDILRGLVMIIMLMDHVRETIYLHMQVGDPMDVETTSPALFFSRLAAHLCAPVFVFLTGLSAWLYSNPANREPRSPSGFLFKRGLFLIFLEFTFVSFAWAYSLSTVYLQVIWAIGLSMIALSVLVRLPYWAIAVIGFTIVFGHNALTPITFAPDEFGYSLWAILHDRNVLIEGPLQVKVSYPVLPWIGVILLGYVAGPLYARTVDPEFRGKLLIKMGAACLALLAILRGFNIYGETEAWTVQDSTVQTVMSFFNFTKYPPSLAFLLLTLGIAFFLLNLFEKIDTKNKVANAVETYGSAPMFFYLLHLYVLHAIYIVLEAVFGPTQGELFGVDQVWWIWLMTIVMAVLLYFPTKAFAQFKHRTKQPWARYL